MKILLLICSFYLLLLSFVFSSKQLIAKKVVTAINCGSSTGAKSNLGFLYQAVRKLIIFQVFLKNFLRIKDIMGVELQIIH